MRFTKFVSLEAETICMKFICDHCQLEGETTSTWNAEAILPSGWKMLTESYKILELCPKCTEKQEIREVFK